MKSLFGICCATILLLACTNNTETSTAGKDSTTQGVDHTKSAESLDTTKMLNPTPPRVSSDSTAIK